MDLARGSLIAEDPSIQQNSDILEMPRDESQRRFPHVLPFTGGFEAAHLRSNYLADYCLQALSGNKEKKSLNITPVTAYWYKQLVNPYVTRKFTYASDRLVAVAGIVRELQPYIEDSEYIAGMWGKDFYRGLLSSNSEYIAGI
jgi:hypothetical protein